MLLGKDGTYKDYCAWYGADCGECFKRFENVPPPACYEPHNEGDIQAKGKEYLNDSTINKK